MNQITQDTHDEHQRNWKQLFLVATLVFVVVALLGYSLLYAFAPSTLHTFFAQKQAAHDMVEQTYNADNAIDNYEWFKTQKQKIEMKQLQIQDTRQQLKSFKDVHGTDASDWTWQQQQQYDRLTTTLLGQKQMYQKLVADYNARSLMQNRNVFKDKLPYEMERKFWTGDIIP